MEFSIYLDVCCLNRPFDDQTQERIRLEAEAVRLILTNCQRGEWLLLTSQVIEVELKRTPDSARKDQMRLWTAFATSKIMINEQIESRGSQLAELGFKNYDALHIACAEAGNADIFLTTDDRMLRLAARCRNLLQVRLENPLQWVMEATHDRRD
ncbi:MAG: PIN domain-containing protein [Mojavia pulchra JT2-VF2]|uniref:PIN domain-containing protein n=1 Tax=Mojavia pulchra JT2-VF2 TaxID=287848 RepID=A0A951PZ94_9NOST|nr:PIN domain-containing protein [Mojavia pulchra JT2-VF2]